MTEAVSHLPLTCRDGERVQPKPVQLRPAPLSGAGVTAPHVSHHSGPSHPTAAAAGGLSPFGKDFGAQWVLIVFRLS